MDIASLESCLLQLKSVESCKVIANQAGQVEEIHIITRSNRSPKQISRDIQSLLISKFGIDIDHKKISIAQLESYGDLHAESRLRIRTIEYCVSDMKLSVKVILERDDTMYEGTAAGPYTSSNILKLIAVATLKAVHSCIGFSDVFELESITSIDLSGNKIVVCLVNCVYWDNEKTFCGSAIVEADKKEAAVKATLDAINRLLPKIEK